MSRSRLLLALLFAVFCISASSIMVRAASAPALVIAFYRLSLTALFGGLLSSWRRQSWFGLRDSILRVLLSGFFLALHFGFWITSLSHTSIASAVLFANLQIVFVVVLSAIFLREKIQPGAAVGVGLALLGGVVIGGGDLLSGRLVGDLMALAGGLFFAIHLLIGRQVRSKIDLWPYTTVVSLAAAVAITAAVVGSAQEFGGYPAVDYGLFVLMALLPGLGGHGVINWALKYLKAPVVAVAVLGESVGASVLGYLIFHEALAWFQVVGGLVVLSGLWLAVSRETSSFSGIANQ